MDKPKCREEMWSNDEGCFRDCHGNHWKDGYCYAHHPETVAKREAAWNKRREIRQRIEDDGKRVCGNARVRGILNRRIGKGRRVSRNAHNQITVAWFSAGVSSAVATKLMVDSVDHILYCHIADQHPDTLRFVRDCEAWFGKPVEILRSPYATVENAIRANGSCYINGPRNTPPCTRYLKQRVRKEWEAQHRFFCWFRYVWGMDSAEQARADRLRTTMREDEHFFPLIDRGLSKADAHGILRKEGIKRPAMYDLGYPNNNCIGCVKGGMGYWNKIRVDFPDVFASRAALERTVGGSCINGIYLDELDPMAGRDCKIIVPECGAMCERMMAQAETDTAGQQERDRG